MFFYLGLMLFFLVMSCRRSCSSTKMFLAGIVLFVIMGLKSETIGNDTPSYIEFYNRLQRMGTLIDSNSRFEIGYQLLNKIVGLLFEDVQALFVVVAVICIGCIMYGCSQYSCNWQYSLFLLVGLRFFYFFLSGLRQSIAVSIIFVSYKYLNEKKIVKFVLLVLLASSFHLSAIFFLLAWPISKFKWKKTTIMQVIVIVLGVYLLFSPILQIVMRYLPSYYSHYIGSSAFEGNKIANYIGAIIPCTILFFSYVINYKAKGTIVQTSAEKNIDVNMQKYFLLVSAGISFIATRASLLDRLVQYFWIFAIIAIPNMLFSIKDMRKRLAWYLIIIVIC